MTPLPEYRTGRTPYDAEVAYADAMVGRLLARLDAAHALDRTLIVVTADHGESLGEHGETTHGLFAYSATLAVPLVLNGPSLGPATVDAPVSPHRHCADDSRPDRSRAARTGRRPDLSCVPRPRIGRCISKRSTRR